METKLYVGTEEGLFSLSNAGGSWQVKEQGLQPWEIADLVQVPGSSNEVFAATRGDGVWFTADGGATWRKPCYGKRGPGKVHCLELDGSGQLYAGCEPIDLFVSSDMGQSWRLIDSVWSEPWVAEVSYPNKKVEPHLRDLAIDPRNGTTIYAGLQVGYMLKSKDGGSSWKVLNQDLDPDVHVINLNPHNPDTMVVATGGDGARRGETKGRALYRTDDGGESWTPVGLEFEQTYSQPLIRHPKDPNVLYSALAVGNQSRWKAPKFADSAIIRSTDGGRHWERLDGGLSETSTGFAEALAFDEQQPERMFAGFRNGEVYMTESCGESWRKLDVKLPSITRLAVAA